jgi:hypothetical protein
MASENSSIATGGISAGGPSLKASTFGFIGGAVSDLFAASADKVQANALGQEAADYRKSAAWDRTLKIFDKTNEDIGVYQAERQVTQGLGSQHAAIGGAGFKDSGTALYLMMDSARQGALHVQMTQQTGEIAIASHEEEAQAFDAQAAAADAAAAAANKKKKSDTIGAVIQGALAVASVFV